MKTAAAVPRCAAVCALVALFAALWWAPVQQARFGPQARAESFVALTICRNIPAAAGATIPIRDLARPRPVVTSHTPAQVTELASPFVTHFARGWWMELGAVALAAAGVVALATMPVAGATLAFASLAAYVSLHGLEFDGYTLVKLNGVGYWLTSIGAWDAPMILRYLVAPAAFVAIAAASLWMLWTAVQRRRPGRERVAERAAIVVPASTHDAART